MRRHRIMGLVIAASISSTNCKLNLTPEGLYKGVKGVMDARKDLTPENEYYVGRAVGTNILARANYAYLDKADLQQGRLSGLTLYVNAVGAVLASAALELHRDSDRPAPIAGWHITILDDATVNAFAAPGGYIFVTRGAVELATSEDELAAVLAHEIAHVQRGHALGSIKKSRISAAYKDAIMNNVELDEQALSGLTETFNGALDDISSAYVKGYSRDTEFEADAVGVEILARAGYNTSAFVSYLDRLQKQQATGSGGISSTHPKAVDRIVRLTKLQAKFANNPLLDARTQRFVAARDLAKQKISGL
jgi:beta-barrel assembly-enhancing protease